MEFQKLFENVMIRSTSGTQCESIGSIMNQHSGKNRHLEPEYFSMELVLRVNLGKLNMLKGLINEVLASDPDRSYLRKEDRISQLTEFTRVQQLQPSRQMMKTSLVFPNLFGVKVKGRKTN
jgi:hypothetical protein